MTTGAINAILLLALVTALITFLYGQWQSICVDWMRQHVFEARDAIFDLAADGKLSFDSDEYRTIREGLQHLLRFAHFVRWPTTVHFHIIVGRLESPPKNAMTVALRNISDGETRRVVGEHVKRAHEAAIRFLVLRSPMLWFLVLAMAVIVGLRVLLRSGDSGVERRMGQLRQMIQLEAEASPQPQPSRWHPARAA